MKNSIIIFFSVFFLLGCGNPILPLENSEETNSLKDSEEDFQLIRDNLYEDDSGRIFHRTIDVSRIGSPIYSYADRMFVDTVINGELTFYTPLISDIIDKETFHLVSVNSTKGQLMREEYADKNHQYFLLVVADGGTLNMSK